MKWMLIVLVVGGSPTKTNLLFDTLDQCLAAEDTMRSEYVLAFNKWRSWAKANPAELGFPDSEEFMRNRIGVNNYGTCIPHGPNSN